MRPSPRLALFCVLAALPLVACGRSYSYACTERECTASFEGAGEQDLSEARGPIVEVVRINDPTSVTVRIDGKDARLVEKQPRRVQSYVLTLTNLDGENVMLRSPVRSDRSRVRSGSGSAPIKPRPVAVPLWARARRRAAVGERAVA